MRFSSWKRSGLDRGRFSLRKTALGSLLLAAPLLGALAINGASPVPVSAAMAWGPGSVAPSGEESLDGTGLNVTIASSTSTDISQAYTLTMTSSSQTGYNNGAKRNNVFVVIDDDAYDPDAQPEEGGELPVYTAAVHWIDYSSKATTIYIPKTVTVKGRFTLTVHAIESCASYREAIVKGDAYAEGDETDYGYGTTKATQVFIPSSIETIEAGAFNYFPATTSFAFEADSIQEGFEAGWTDCPESRMTFNQTAKTSDIEVSVSATISFGKSAGYIIGYYEKNEYYSPLLVTYDLYKRSGELVQKDKVHVMALSSEINVYDAIGGNVGSKSVTLHVDLETLADEYVDPTSLVFHNIHAPIQVPSETGGITFVPDLSQAYTIRAKVGKTVAHTDISTFFETRPNRISTFMGYLEVDVDLVPTTNFYEVTNPTFYSTYEDDIKAGIYTPRILLFNLQIAEYEVTYTAANGYNITVVGQVNTPIGYAHLEPGKVNTVGFTISMDWITELAGPDAGRLTYDNLVSVNLLGFSVKTDLWINASNNSLNKSDTVYRFGALSLTPGGKAKIAYTNLLGVLFIGFGIYLGAAILLAVGYYIYAKRRFRNDEFRRVNDKKYWIAATKNILGFALIFLAILFIVMRFAIMITTVVAFNPLDVFVIVFALAGAIFLGFAIKGLVTAIRNSMKRKNDLKLHLGNDKAEDGTR